MSSTILSTKKLSLAQKELLLNAKINFVAYDAVKIDFKDFTLPAKADNYIFTSQNAVLSFLKKGGVLNAVFCVGLKTKALLETNGFKVLQIANNAMALAKIIVEKYKNESFIHLTGNLRRPELPTHLKKNNVRYNEVEVYHTIMQEKQFNQSFDGVLFFSPSGVQSYSIKNKLNNATAFCIGETTANEAKKLTQNIIVANTPSIENVLVQAIKYNRN